MKIDNRIWVIITVILCGALVAGGWFLGASPLLAAASDADSQRATVESQNAAIAAEVSQLEKDQANEEDLKAQLATLTGSIPAGVDGDGFLRELDSLVSSSGVELTNWSLSTPTPYAAPAGSELPATATGDGATPSASPSASADPAPAATTTETASIVPYTDPLITSNNFITVPVTITVTGGDDEVTSLLSGLQAGKRLVLVNNVDKKVGDDGVVTLTIQGTLYVLRDPSTAGSAAASGSTSSNG